MAAAAAVIVLLCLLMSSAGSQKQDINASLLRVVGALEKLIGFYKAEYQHMNLDGMFGLKVVEGQIQRLLEEHQQGQHAHLNPQLVQRLHTIQQEASRVSAQAVEAVRADDEKYFENLAFIVNKPWYNFKSHRRIVPTMRWEIPVYRNSLNDSLNEKYSDMCMMEITGVQEDSGVQGRQCSFSHKCGRLMTKRGLMDYGITHQLLWTALAEKAGCHKELNALLQQYGYKDVDVLQLEFCTNNYYEMLAVVHVFMKGKVHDNYQDLFLEQQFVCPNLGFFEFLKKEYLDQILSWQWPSGCFGDDPNEPESQELSHLPPKLDLSKLGAGLSPRNISRAKNLDLQQQQVKQQLGSLKSNNKMVQSLMDRDSKRVESQARGSQQLPNMHAVNVDSLVHKPGQLARNIVAENNAVPANNPSFVRNRGNLKSVEGAAGPINKFNMAGHGQELGGLAAQQGLQMKEAVPVRANWLGGRNDKGQGQPLALPDHLAGGVGRRTLAYETGQGTRRKLLVEKAMPGGCLAHKTGVAGGALVMYLRYLIDPGPLDFYSQHEFFPGDQGIMADPGASSKLMAFLGNQEVSFDSQNEVALNDVLGGAQQGDEGDEEEEEEGEDDENAEYDDQDEMYPDRGGAGAGDTPHHEKKVVHFGANDNLSHKNNADDGYDDANEDEDEEYADEDEEEDEDEEDEEEEEGPDYIKRGKGDDNVAANTDDEDNQDDDDTEYTYYDDNDNTEKGIIKKLKLQPPPQPGARIRSHSRHKTHSAVMNDEHFRQADMPPTRTFVFLLSASSIVLIIFMYRFIKKRRIHLRYHSRGFFRL